MKISYNFPIIIIICFFVCALKIPGGMAQHVTLYEHSDRGGQPFRFDIKKGNCITLPERLNDKTSSIDTHGTCLFVYARSDCKGNHLKIMPNISTYISNLKRAKFNDVISSVKACYTKNALKNGRYAIQNVEDKMYLTAKHLVQGYTMVETEGWSRRISQQWDVEKTRDGTYWLIPRTHVSKNHLTYEMNKLKKEDFPEIGMFKERVYWVLENIQKNKYIIKNDDTGDCLTKPDNDEIEQDECDPHSKNQQWLFYQVL